MAKMALQSVRRAAFDIGSGSTKMQCSDCVISLAHDEFGIEISSCQIVNVLFSQERPVAFGADWVKSSDGNLSTSIQELGLKTLQDLRKIACELGATEFSGIATEVFRKAKNGSKYLEKVVAAGVPVVMVAQEIEAELGFRSVVAVSRDTTDTIVWDSGGASFQITSLNTLLKPAVIRSYMGALGSSISTRTLVENVRHQSVGEAFSINPVTTAESHGLIESLIEKLTDVPDWLIEGVSVKACAGANSIFKLCSDVLLIHARDSDTGKADTDTEAGVGTIASFTIGDARRALELCIDKSDDELLKYVSFPHADGPHLIVPKLCLLVAVMTHAKLGSVSNVLCAGSCPGILTMDRFWTSEPSPSSGPP